MLLLLCCWRLKCNPLVGLRLLSCSAKSIMVGNWMLKKVQRSDGLNESPSSTNWANKSKTVWSAPHSNSSGSKLVLKWEKKRTQRNFFLGLCYKFVSCSNWWHENIFIINEASVNKWADANNNNNSTKTSWQHHCISQRHMLTGASEHTHRLLLRVYVHAHSSRLLAQSHAGLMLTSKKVLLFSFVFEKGVDVILFSLLLLFSFCQGICISFSFRAAAAAFDIYRTNTRRPFVS